jgi:hypothetical protein
MDARAESRSRSLLVATVSGRDPKWPYPQCLAEMIAMTRRFDGTQFESEIYSAVDQGRCRLARKAIKKGFSHILFIDDDHYFPFDTADALLAHNKPIVAANYTSRSDPIRPLSLRDGKRLYSKGRSGLERVDQAPGGVMMIETRVFEALAFPWFKTEWIGPKEEDWQSDDYYFCDKARAAGFEIFIDHDLSQEIGHVGEHAFNHGMLHEPESTDIMELAREMLSCL